MVALLRLVIQVDLPEYSNNGFKSQRFCDRNPILHRKSKALQLAHCEIDVAPLSQKSTFFCAGGNHNCVSRDDVV